MKKNKTAICLASGSSLTLEDVEFCRGKGKIYAVKECAFLAPWADVLYAADTDWWDFTDRWKWFEGEKWTVSGEAKRKYPELNFIEYMAHWEWSTDQRYLATGGNSGFQAINLAELQGAEKIILLGYDMGYSGDKHWWENTHKRESRWSDYKTWIERFNKAVPHIKAEVINCTRQTALNCFPKMDLKDAL